MAGDLRGFALEKAELLSSRLKELLSSGQDYVRAQFGVDLGLKPEVYPTWVILSTAAVGLLLLLGLSWAAVCGGLFVGKKRGSPVVTQGNSEPSKANLAKTAKPEEQKKRNKKKTNEKNSQSNGQPVAVAQEEVQVTEVVSKLASQIKTDKAHEVQAPVQVKKNKKKTKTSVKPVQHVYDGKEPDDGAWETKVSNREKRQQRRKDKGPEDSGGPGGLEAPKSNVDAPAAAAPHPSAKKNRGNHESLHSRAAGKGEAASGAVSSWREEPSVNGGGWTDVSAKIPRQMGALDGTKWGTVPAAAHYRAPPKPQSWGQETQAWSGIDGRMKTDLNPVSFSMLGLNTTEPISNSVELQWTRRPDVDDEWSAFNGMAAVDPSSDWNAPEEHWGNYEEPPELLTPLKEPPVHNKQVSEDEKDTDDPSAAAKSKKKRKKKKRAEEEAAAEAQTVISVPLVSTDPPAPASKKQNPSISSSQKKCEQTAEPLKSQKKKVRRET